MMNKRLKARWIKALRSGKYKQHTQALCAPKEEEKAYCCMGVLLSVNGVADGSMRRMKGFEDSEPLPCHYGISEEKQRTLAALNDTKRWSFKQIASYIERYL